MPRRLSIKSLAAMALAVALLLVVTSPAGSFAQAQQTRGTDDPPAASVAQAEGRKSGSPARAGEPQNPPPVAEAVGGRAKPGKPSSGQSIGGEGAKPSTSAAGQREESAANALTEPGGLREVGPEIYYLPDEKGKLHPVPGWNLEDFRRLIEAQGARPEAPRYSLQRLLASGHVVGDRARLKVEVSVKLYDHAPRQWVRVPLQLGGAVLESPAEHHGDGDFILDYQEGADGYVAWLRGGEAKPHAITLQLLAPLKVVGNSYRLTCNLPRAAPSQVKLTVPLAAVEAEVADGATLLPPTSVGGRTELTVLGTGGEMTLSWRPPESQLLPRARLLEVEGAQRVRIDRGQIRTHAQLTVHGLGGEFDRFRVRLPRASRLLTERQSGYTVTQLDPNAQAGVGAAPAVPVAEIRLDKKTRGPVDVRLVCEQTYDPNRDEELASVGGFEVEGAVRQWGNVAVQVIGDWRLAWDETTNVRRVNTLTGTVSDDEVAAGFEYFAQPFALSARILPPATRVAVEPEYVVDVAADPARGATQLTLDAKLKYLVNGAKTFELSIDLAGWEIDEGSLGPAGRVAAGEVVPPVDEQLKIPLASALRGEFEIALKARRTLPGATGLVTWEFPRPVADSIGPATVVILSSDNVQLTPRPEATFGLAALPLAAQIELPQREQSPFYYRAEQPDARFAADLEVHARHVAAQSVSRIRLTEHTAEIRETITYDVAYEPVEWLSFEVPRELAAPQTLRLALGDDALAPVFGRQSDGVPTKPAMTSMRVPLKKPRIGRMVLTIDYQVPLEALVPATTVPVVVPLVVPGVDRLRHCDLVVESAPGISAEPSLDDWSTVADRQGTAGDSPSRRYRAKSGMPQASLMVAMRDQPKASGILVHRGWIQSWFAADGRHDQAAFVFTSRESNVDIALPDGVDPGAAEIWLDGKSLAPRVDASSALSIPLPRPAGGEHQLVLRYVVPGGQSRWWRRVATPRFVEGALVERLYWQIVLPPKEHLLAAPASATPEYTWHWRRFGLSREPVLTDAALLDWLGVPMVRDSAPSAAGKYLLSLSTMGDTFWLPVVPRGAIVLLSAGCILGVGLLLIHVRWLRRADVLFSAAVVLLAAGVFFPEPAVLMSQAASFGLLLVILVGILRRALARHQPQPVLVRGSAGSSLRHVTTEFYIQPSGAISGGSTSSQPAERPSGAATGKISTVTK